MKPEAIKELIRQRNVALQNKEAILNSKQIVMNSVLTEEIKQQLKDIEEEYAPDLANVDKVIKGLESDIKFYCTDLQQTVKGDTADVVFYKGRASWDSKGLEGYAVAHPEVLNFKKFGKPYAVIKNK